MIEYGPITTWPGQMTPPGARRPSSFKAPFSDSLRKLEDELRLLRATEIRVELAIPREQWRQDGRPRAHAVSDHPGVVVRAKTKHGDLAYATDRFTHWHDNLRAVALGLHDLRRLERYGIADRGQQYAGFKQLTSGGPSADRGRELIRQHGSVRAALMATHPDHGGSDADFADVQAARVESA
jgi:hypothetical protein